MNGSILTLCAVISLIIVGSCTTVRTIHTGPGRPTSYYIKCYADMGNCLQRAVELCPSGYNVTTTTMSGDWHAAVVACQERDVPLR
jgi:hypothetical protein